MTWHLQNEGHAVNEKRIRRLMRLMRLMPIYQKPNTSKPANGHKTYPYLLGGLRIDRPNQVWCADITYVPMPRGHAYLCAVMDWHSRKVLGWAVSNTMGVDLCLAALEMALATTGAVPGIFNTDQGSQFTSSDWLSLLKQHGMVPSMSRHGNFHDNAVAESFFSALKKERIKRRIYPTRDEARSDVFNYIEMFYNPIRRHGSAGNLAPVEFERRYAQSGS